MQHKAKETLRIILGVFLIIVGLAGIILPILPGWWVILIGLEILGWKLVINHHNKSWWQKFSFKYKKKID